MLKKQQIELPNKTVVVVKKVSHSGLQRAEFTSCPRTQRACPEFA